MDEFETTVDETEKQARDAQETDKLAHDIAEHFPTGISDGTPILIPPTDARSPQSTHLSEARSRWSEEMHVDRVSTAT